MLWVVGDPFRVHSASRYGAQTQADSACHQHRAGAHELEAEISELGGIDRQLVRLPQRRYELVVVAGDSQTIVIGGLMGDRDNSVTKIPIERLRSLVRCSAPG